MIRNRFRQMPEDTGRTLVNMRLILLCVLCTVMAGACSSMRPKLPEPLRGPNHPDLQSDMLMSGLPDAGKSRTESTAPIVITPPPGSQPDPALLVPIQIPPMPNPSKPVSLVLDGVPLSVFIDVVFANELKFPVSIDRGVRERGDLVSLRVAQPTAPQNLYRAAAELLRTYGVTIVSSGGALRFSAGAGGGNSGYTTTRDPSKVPGGSRVFVLVPLGGRSVTQVSPQLRAIYPQPGPVTLTEQMEAGAILVSGSADAVRDVIRTINELDKAADQGSVRIRPQFIDVQQLSTELRDVMRAQGYTVKEPGNVLAGGAISFVLIPSSNQLLVFSASMDALKAAADWADKLDQPASADGGSGGAYVYAPRHTTVNSLMPVLSALVGGPISGGAAANRPGATAGGLPVPPGTPMAPNGMAAPMQASRPTVPTSVGGASQTVSGPGGQMVADAVRNILVFQGDAQRWRAIQSVLAKLDVPTRQVVIEVTVAEVTLNDEFSNGVEWAIRNMRAGTFSGPARLLPGGYSGGAGLIWSAFSRGGELQATLNLFAKDQRINILSTPRIMVKSGEQASISVGDEVPVVTSQATAADLPITGGTSSILQQVQYRKTGVLLDVTATVHSNQRVDLEISQEVSNAATTDTSKISSPTIQTRKAKTSLTLADGQSMLLGGLISNTTSTGKSKIPLLGDIPVLGSIFSSRKQEGKRTELLMLITPYIISDADEARVITEVATGRFETGNQKLRVETLPARVPTQAVPAKTTLQTPASMEAAPAQPSPLQVQPATPQPDPAHPNPNPVPPAVNQPAVKTLPPAPRPASAGVPETTLPSQVVTSPVKPPGSGN